MSVKQCHKPPICWWFIPAIYDKIGMVYYCSTHIIEREEKTYKYNYVDLCRLYKCIHMICQ
jgi:hypothetical protein